MHRINVIGISCAGKTTLARALAARLDVPHVELDALYWERDWTPASDETFRARVAESLRPDTWVADGGYQVARDITWGRADTVVWLDYRLRVILPRYLRRTVSRVRSSEEFWPGTGNRETMGNVLRRDGLLWFILRQHRGKRRRTARRLAARPDLRQIRLRSPAETERWLESLG
jgi:hypothetical protein